MKFQPTNPITAASGPYVSREADDQFLHHLDGGVCCNLRAGRLAGKTSLVFTARDRLLEAGHIVIFLSLDQFQQETLLEAWRAVVRTLIEKLGLQPSHPSGDLSNCEDTSDVTRYLCAKLEEKVAKLPLEQRIYVFLDEVDSILRSPQEVNEWLLGLRLAIQQDYLLRRVCWVFVSLRPLEFMVDSRMTGGATFNAALRVELGPFPNVLETWEKIRKLGFDDERPEMIYPVIEKVLALTGGNAQLTSIVLYHLQIESDSTNRDASLDRINKEVLTDRSFVSPHIDGISLQLRSDLQQTIPLLNSWERVITGEEVPVIEGGQSFEFLHGIGLLKIENDLYVVANPIYEARLHRGWLQDVTQLHQMERDRPTRSRLASGRKVAVFAVGGTMGMVTERGQSFFPGAQNLLRRVIPKELKPFAEVEWIHFGELDGINVTPADWVRLATQIHERRNEFDGFIIAHGTDTLASTAAGLAFILGRSVEKPVVLTGAQATISVPHGDTLDNFRRSCLLAASPIAPREVQVQFGNHIYRAVCVEKADDRLFQGFRSPGWPELGQVSETLLVNRYALEGRCPPETDYGFQPQVSANIPAILIMPGMPARLFQAMLAEWQAKADLDGVIVHTPGAGNIPNRGQHNARDLIQATVEAGLPVLVTSQVPINPYTQPQYEMSRAVTDYGAILAGNMGLPAAHAKFAWVIGCVNHEARLHGEDRMREIASRMHYNFQGELADPMSGLDARPR